ncbi:hypothetical protein C8R46DRAFT_1092072 [Mycena filopes]|nr:hypothetical protein C8R46DRAFT_1092072 [Mycena filopes]
MSSTLMKPAKFKTPTCVLCRRRKLRCDGGEPCGPCSRTRTPVTCTYVPKTVGQLRSELPKGGACITCRQRKRRCDGNFPCRTCIQTGRPDDCKYREKAPSKQNAPRSKGREDHSSSDSASTCSSSSRPTTPLPSTSQRSGSLRIHDHTSPDPLFLWSELNPTCLSSYSGDSTCAPDSLYAFPPHDSISFPTLTLDPLPQDRCSERFSVRNLFLEHAMQYGLSVTPEKRAALSIGDLSQVDSTLVHICELLGHLYRVHSHPDGWLPFNSQTTAEAELDRLIREDLEGSAPVLDPLLRLQSYVLLSAYSAQKEDIRGFQRQLARASGILVQHEATLGLEDIQALDWSPQFDVSYLSPHTVAEEARAVFSQMIIFDIAGSLVLNVPSVLDPRLVEKFRRLAAIRWTDTEINFLRAKSLLFLSDSQKLVAGWSRWEFGDPAPTAWSKRYWGLVDEVNSHINFLNTALMDVSCIPALQGAQPTLKVCMLHSQAALAELYALFAPSRLESRQKHLEAATEIVNISRGFADEDFDFLDPTLGVCWAVASRAIYNGGWNLPDSRAPNEALSQGSLIFLHECNRRVRRTAPYTFPF